MPRRKEEFPTKKVTMYLFDGEWQKLKRYYPRIGGSKIMRWLLNNHLRELDAGRESPLGINPEDIQP